MGDAKRRREKRAKDKAVLNEKVLDYCTASPDLNFSDCCKKHDEEYESATISRWESDKKLRQCISQKGIGFYKYKVLPWIYWAGVRVFGGSHYGSQGGKKCRLCQKIKGFFL